MTCETILIAAAVFALCMWPGLALFALLSGIFLSAAGFLLFQAWVSLSGLAFFGLLAFGAWIVIGLPLALHNLPQS